MSLHPCWDKRTLLSWLCLVGFGREAQASASLYAGDFQAGQNLGFKSHGIAGIGHVFLMGDFKIPAAPAIGRLARRARHYYFSSTPDRTSTAAAGQRLQQ